MVNNTNYFKPLQTQEDDDEDDIIIEKTIKVHIAPITILKCKTSQIKELCDQLLIKNYSIRKISIGLKLFCSTKEDFNIVCKKLENKFEYFTYCTKDEKPYKAVLLGLDKFDPAIVKHKLNKMGLTCLEVKLVTKTRGNNNEQCIYIVYFQRKSITLKELKQNYSVIDYVKVKWDFQKRRSSKITQCYNCQMLGHGSKQCKVRTFCANCAGTHSTADCKSDTILCANCNGKHKSTFAECPSRENFQLMRQRAQPRAPRLRRNQTQNASFVNRNGNYNNDFPNTLNQGNNNINREWNQQHNNNLFSLDEIKSLTMELISKLKNCKSKEDQFEVITSLACKFLYK